MEDRVKYKPFSTREEKVLWLLKHQDLWEGFPYGPLSDPRCRLIVRKMKEDGLLSWVTYWPDVKLHNLINAARKLRREGKVK